MFCFAFVLVFAACVALYIYQWHFDLESKYGHEVIDLHQAESFRVLDVDGKELAELPAVVDWKRRLPEYRNRLDFEKISEPVIRAILAAEDKRFWEHNGIDKYAIFNAGLRTFLLSARQSIKSFRFEVVVERGASTLTQQEVRLIFLGDELAKERSGEASNLDKLLRKIEEARIATWFEGELEKQLGSKRLAKEKIFEIYANINYCGGGRYGVAACSKFYFGKDISELDYGEAASIAGSFASPRTYSPLNNIEMATKRRNTVISRMVENKFLSEETARELSGKPIKIFAGGGGIIAPAAVHHILTTFFSEKGFSWKNGWTVETTIKKDFQLWAEEAASYGIKLYRDRHPEHLVAPQGAFVVVAHDTGEVLAVVGGTDTTYFSFNRATEAKRQPGSSFKPFVFTAALEKGWRISCLDVGSGECRILDSPVRVPMGNGRLPHLVKNYDGRYLGMIELWRAIAESRNAPTVRLASRISPQAIVDLTIRMGLNKDIEAYPTTAIGAEEVVPLELTAAYSIFANGGWKIKPHVVRRILNEKKEEVYSAGEIFKERVLSDDVAREMAKALRHTIVWRSGTGRRLAPIELALIGKTGTTDDFRDAWFCGSIYGEGGITACAWIGFDDNSPLSNPELCEPLAPPGASLTDANLCESGGRVALPAFKYFVEKVEKGYSHLKKFPFEDEVLRAEQRK